MRLSEKNRVAILLHEGISGRWGKTGVSFLRYGQTPVVAAIDRQHAGESLPKLTGISKDIPIVASVSEALSYQPDVLLIGIAPSGGILPSFWWEEIEKAVAAGLSVVNGLHTPIASKFDKLEPEQWIWDIRQEPQGLKVAAGIARSLPCHRILTVGTDMGVGKMSTCLELHAAALRRQLKSKFLATGQGGIVISGSGIPLDAVRVDFAAGAVEGLVLEFGNEYDLLWVEGQGSLLHPGSTATISLLRGSQPTGLVLVHRAGQEHVRDLPDFPIPPLAEVVNVYETVAYCGGSFDRVKVKAIALNTAHLDEPAAKQAIEKVKQETGLPCTDAVRFGGDELLDAII